MLREDLKIEWSHVLEHVSENENGHTLQFKDKKTVSAKLVIDTSGVHSRVRKVFLPTSEPRVLPYVVFRGTRHIEGPTFKEIYQSKFRNGNTVQLRKDDVLLQVWINNYQKESDDVDISYVYSRLARENDSLHRPGRAPRESSDIREAIFRRGLSIV
jgi:2-polyprenyl-6-methoxyphenol hydroxylase-like FAD-dependent oxidoreductase